MPGPAADRLRAALSRARPALSGLALAGAAALAAWLFARMAAFVIDDAFITLRYARHLAEGLGPVWNPGERPPVEGYTNPSYMLALAALEAAGLGGAPALRALGALSLLALVAAAASLGAQLGLSRSERALAVAAIVAHPLTVLHTLGGLETVLYAALLVAVADAAGRLERAPARGAALRVGALAVLLGLTRPEGWLVALVAAASPALPWPSRPAPPTEAAAPSTGVPAPPDDTAAPRRQALLACALVAAALALVVALRYAYYRDLVPNTFHVKSGGLAAPRRENLRDLWRLAAHAAPVVLLAPAGLVLAARERRRALVAVAAAGLALWAYYATARLSMNYAHRFFYPLVPLAAVLAFTAASRALRALRGLPLAAALAAALLAWSAATAAPSIAFADRYGRGLRATHAALGALLGRDLPPDTRIAVGDAGAIAYFSRLPTIDFLGLNDRYLARHPAPAMPGGIDVDHVLAEDPAVLVLVAGGAPGFPAPPAPGIRTVSLDLITRPAAAPFREIARREFLPGPQPPGSTPYQVVVLARDDRPLPPQLEGDLRRWAAAPAE